MRKQTIYAYIAAFCVLTGCEDFNDKHFEGLDKMGELTDVKNLDYTLTPADYEAIGENPKKNHYFSVEDPADNFLPGWLAKNYITASATSVVRVTFNYLEEASQLLKPYTAIPYVSLEKNEDYTPFYGEGYYAPYLNKDAEGQFIDKLLNVKYADAKKGELLMIGYSYNQDAEPQQMATPLANYTFEELQTGNITSIKGWYMSAPEDKPWVVGNFKNNSYLQYSANGTKGECIAWLVTPEVEVSGDDKKFAFDVAVGYKNADCLSVLIATDFDGKDVAKAHWTDITANFTFPVPEPGKSYSNTVSAGAFPLSNYAGKKIRIAFKYVGDGANKKTTTYQIDNVVVGKDIPKAVTVTPRFRLYLAEKDGVWKEFANDTKNRIFCPAMEDYTAMGDPGKNMTFTSEIKPEDYMPLYLAKQISYPLNQQAAVTICRYNNGVWAKEYIYSAETGLWKLNTQIVEKTRPYAFNGSEWMFDPSVHIILKEKGDKETAAFYQLITDWVKEHEGAEYVSSFGNNDYYYGASAYQNNFDFRSAKWKEQNNDAYGSMSKEELEELMYSRLPEAFVPALEATYPNAEPVEGVKVIYSIKFFIYDGENTMQYTIQYLVTAKGVFEYVEDSLTKLAE